MGTAPAVTTVSGAPGSGNIVAATAYDDQNNLLFYVTRNGGSPAGTVYDSNHAVRGYLNEVQASQETSFAGLKSEMIVVPVPGVCRQYYLLYVLGGPFGGATCYAKINCPVGGPVTIATQSTIIDLTYNHQMSLAVSKPRPNGTRLLFEASAAGIRYCTLNVGGGFTPFGTTNVGALPGSPDTELDISPDGAYMAWSTAYWSSTNQVYLCKLSASTGLPEANGTNPYPLAGARGVEFSGDSKKLFAAAPGGVSVLDVTATTPAFTAVPSTTDAGSTQMELGFDGLVYYVNGSGNLRGIDPCALTVAAAVPGVTLTIASSFSGATPWYLLPDQLDGENYQQVPGTATPTVSFVRIDGQPLNATVARNVYSCNALNLLANLTNAPEVQVTLTPANSSGTATGAALCSTGWLPSLPTEIKTMCGSYLADPTHSGYYLLKLEARNVCETVTTFTGLFRISAMTSSSTSMAFNNCAGTAIAGAGTTATSPATVGGYSGSMTIGFSTGNYTSYQIGFERYESGTYTTVGSPVSVSVSPPPTGGISLAYLADLAGLGSNYFTPSGAGYNKVYRLTLTTTNPCGTSPQVQGHFRAFGTCRPAASPITPPVSVYPNPLHQGTGQLSFSLPRAQRVSLSIVDGLTGREKLVLLHDAPRAAGDQTITFDASSLPEGMYLYRLVTDQVQVGRLLKAE